MTQAAPLPELPWGAEDFVAALGEGARIAADPAAMERARANVRKITAHVAPEDLTAEELIAVLAVLRIAWVRLGRPG